MVRLNVILRIGRKSLEREVRSVPYLSLYDYHSASLVKSQTVDNMAQLELILWFPRHFETATAKDTSHTGFDCDAFLVWMHYSSASVL